MFTKRGGHAVGEGTFWNVTSGQRVDIKGNGVLPGDAESRYFKMSSPVLLALGPVIGLAYVVLLPVIGIVTVATLAAERAVRFLFNVIGRSLSFGWRPRTAYLSGKKKQRSGK